MALGPFGIPEGLPPALERFFRGFASFWDNQQRVSVLGIRSSGDDTVVRLLASRATLHVRAHVQHDGTGGGGETYDANTFVSDVRMDCRASRQQDYTVLRTEAFDYFVWLIPEFLGDDGTTYTRFDGETGNGADQMAFVALGANSQKIEAMRRELENLNEKLERLLAHASEISTLVLDPGDK